MIHLALFFFVALASVSGEGLKVTYIVNEGFCVDSGGKRILLDGLLSERFLDRYGVPELNAKMRAAEAPFDEIDLLLFTHRHWDHFNAETAAAHLRANPKVVLVGTRQVVDALAKTAAFDKIRSRVRASLPEPGADEKLTMGGIPIRVLRLTHSTYYDTDPATGQRRNRHQNVENVGYVVDLPGGKLLHIGDSPFLDVAEYQTFNLPAENVTVAFLGSLFWDDDPTPRSRLAREHVASRHIVLMHLDRAALGRPLTPKDQATYPGLFVFSKPLQANTFAAYAERR